MKLEYERSVTRHVVKIQLDPSIDRVLALILLALLARLSGLLDLPEDAMHALRLLMP